MVRSSEVWRKGIDLDDGCTTYEDAAAGEPIDVEEAAMIVDAWAEANPTHIQTLASKPRRRIKVKRPAFDHEKRAVARFRPMWYTNTASIAIRRQGGNIVPKQVAWTKTSLGKASTWEKAEVVCGLVEHGLLHERVIREFLKQQV